jgi:hypothetical protein
MGSSRRGAHQGLAASLLDKGVGAPKAWGWAKWGPKGWPAGPAMP